jgi:hypothetical protein
MQRPLCAVLASFVLVTTLSKAQERNRQSFESGVLSTSGADTTIVRLLQQSHDLDQQLPVSVRLNVLSRQAQMVSKLRADLGREWANELFTLSFQTKEGHRSVAQNTAMGVLIRLDPDRALELLHTMSMEEPEANWTTSPLKMEIAQQVFQVLVARDGARALPLLEQEAEIMGTEGHYPYAALGYAAMQATSKDWGNNNQRAIQLLQSVFEPAFARYSQNAHGYFDDFQFGRMLDVLAGGLPLDSVQPALRVLVKNLLATDTRKYQFAAEVYSTDGKSAKAGNVIDATILVFGMLINRDPELARELESTRPELQAALEYTKEGRLRLIVGPGRPEDMQSEDPATEMRMDAVGLSHSNPEAAIAKAEQLPDDDKRTRTMLEVARGIAGDSPERAAELIAETQRKNQPTDDEMHFNLISAQAFVAAAQNKKDELHEQLQRGFESANRILLEQQSTGDIHFFAGLAPMIQIGMQNDPDLTITFIESLPSSYLKAEVLLEAASALSMGRRLPLSSRPQQRVDKPYQ